MIRMNDAEFKDCREWLLARKRADRLGQQGQLCIGFLIRELDRLRAQEQTIRAAMAGRRDGA